MESALRYLMSHTSVTRITGAPSLSSSQHTMPVSTAAPIDKADVLELIASLKSAAPGSTPDYYEFDGDNPVVLWNASLVLLNHLIEAPVALRGKRVLELGSGLGHLAVGLARCGMMDADREHAQYAHACTQHTHACMHTYMCCICIRMRTFVCASPRLHAC